MQETIGSVSARADAAARLVISGAHDVDRASEKFADGDEDAYADLLLDALPAAELWLRPRDGHVSVLAALPVALDWWRVLA